MNGDSLEMCVELNISIQRYNWCHRIDNKIKFNRIQRGNSVGMYGESELFYSFAPYFCYSHRSLTFCMQIRNIEIVQYGVMEQMT